MAGLRRAGFNPVFDLSPNHHGVNGAVAGAVVVDGGLYSPGLPEELRSLKPPAVGSNIDAIDQYQALIAERQRYALRRLGSGPNAAGLVRYQCPAATGRVACPVKPQSLGIATAKGRIVPTNAPGAQGDVCRQSTVTVDLDHPDANTRVMGYIGGLYQKHPFGSDGWYDSMRRRSYVESSDANIKSEAEQSLHRPSMRTMGRTKMTLWSVLVTASANLRTGRLWVRRQHAKHLPEQGPAVSDAMRQAAQAHQRTLRRRHRQQREKAARARGRPPD